MLNIIAEPANRASAITSKLVLNIIHYRIYRSGFSSLVLLDENVMSSCRAMNFPPFSPFYEEFNGKVSRMISGGLIEYWYSNYLGLKKAIRVDEIGPEILTMEHLEIGFVICLIPMVLSILVFISELLAYHRKILIQKVINN